MKHRSSQKTRLWPAGAEIRRSRQKGAITLLAAFLFFVFSTLGMGMFYVSRVYLHISAYKKNVLLLEYASENGIKLGFEFLMKKLGERPNPIFLDEHQAETLEENTFLGGLQAVQELTGLEIFTAQSSRWEQMEWEYWIEWTPARIESKEQHFKADYTGNIQSRGKLENFKPCKNSTLSLEIAIFCGHIPLAQFPFLIDRLLSPDQKSEFLSNNPVEFLPPEENKTPSQARFSDEKILPQSAGPQIEKALNIKLFQPHSLSLPQLRQALGLDISDESVPEGVYLIQDDLGLGGIYIQGDCDEMILAIEGDYQVISFAMGERLWILKFSLVQGRTQFTSPGETRVYELIPMGIVIVSGAVHSLGGGRMDPSGKPILVRDEEIPCLLSGANLTILSSDKITLSSHLIHQGVEWREGIPYIKYAKSMLNIFAAGKDFFSSSEKAGQITVDEDAPKEIKIQASLTASNKGLEIEGEDKTVHVFGSLQASNLTSNGSTLKIKHDERFIHQSDLLANTPKSVKLLLYLSSLKLLGWSETTW